MKAHHINIHLLVPRSRSSAKVQVKYQGRVSQKMGVSGALVFHKHILFFSFYSDVVETVDIINTFVDHVVICINNKSLISMVTADKQLKIICDLKLEKSQKTLKRYCCTGENCAILHETKSICILLDVFSYPFSCSPEFS